MLDKVFGRAPGGVFYILMAATLFSQAGLGIQRSIYPNFVGQELGIGAQQLGWIESIREVPGLLTILLAAATAFFREPVLAGLCMVAMSLGQVIYSRAQGFSGLIAATLVMSVGMHRLLPVQDGLILKLSKRGEKATRLGQLNSITALAGLLGMGFVYLTARYLPLRSMFLVAAAVIMIGALIMLLAPRDGLREKRPNFVFRWKYRSYYALALLSGSRRHINLTFAGFALVTVHHVPVSTISVLLAVSSVLAIYTRPALGRLIDAIGEQRTLITNYILVAGLFLGYAFLGYRPAVYAVFVLDNLLTGFDIAITTHLDKIAVREDISPTLAMGGTINHISGVSVPVIGGYLWERFGPASTFTAGAVVAVLSALFSWRLARSGARKAGEGAVAG